MTRRGQFMPRQSIKGQGDILKRVLKFILARYKVHVLIVVLLIGLATWCTLQGTLFTQSLIDEFISPMLRWQQQEGEIPAAPRKGCRSWPPRCSGSRSSSPSASAPTTPTAAS